jgi:hypothetical protein
MIYRKYHDLSGKINNEMLDKLILILSDKDCVNHVIYFTSQGGFTNITDVMVSMIKHYNHHGSGKRCMIVVHDLLQSNGFNICFMLPKTCIKYTGILTGMIHEARVEVEITGNNKHYYEEDDAKKDNVVFVHGEDLKLFRKIGVTKGEIDTINKQKSVYFQHPRMVELFEKNGIKKFN